MSESTATELPPEKSLQSIPEATILFAGDSGDGMQLAGSQFTLATAYARNDLATQPDFPAEIRAPAGTTYGVSGFQLHFGSVNIRTPGDEVDLLVAMNPAALKVNLSRVSSTGVIIVNTDAFSKRDLDLAKYEENPLEDDSLRAYRVVKIPLTKLTHEALADFDLDKTGKDRTKNMFALGVALWLYSRPMDPAIEWLSQKFAKKETIRDANIHVMKKGFHFGETTEAFQVRYEVNPATLDAGTYRTIRGAEAVALGLVAATAQSGIPLFYGSYPITPASDLLHELSRHKNFGVMTFQAEDEIAAIGAAIGASFGGSLGICATSGPGLALKGEALGLALMTELPMVVIDMQRGGPSTGLPTKTEQSDLLMALYGRNGDSPLPVVSASSPGDCFFAIYEACRISVKYTIPVVFLADGYMGTGAEPWKIPDVSTLPDFPVSYATKTNRKVDGEAVFLPYVRDEETLARPWAKPGTKGLEHRLGGLEKQHETGNVSYDPENHEYMVKLRAEKVERIVAEIPPSTIYGDESGDVLIIGWGSTRGAIEASVEKVRAEGSMKVGHLHLRFMNPLPPDLGEIIGRYEKVVVAELNNGQLVRVLRDRFLLPFVSVTKIQGQPFGTSELVARIKELA